MSLILELPEDLSAQLKAEAVAQGVSVDKVALEILQKAVQTNGAMHTNGQSQQKPPADPEGYGVLYVSEDEPDPLEGFDTLGDLLRAAIGKDYPCSDVVPTHNYALKEGFGDKHP